MRFLPLVFSSLLASFAPAAAGAEPCGSARDAAGALAETVGHVAAQEALADLAGGGSGCARAESAATVARAIAQATGAKRAKLYTAYAELALAERDPALQRQMALDLDRLKEGSGESPAAADEAIAEILPERPPYESLFGRNGDRKVVDVKIHAGAESFRLGGYLGAFRRLGAKIDKRSPTDWTIEWKVTPDDARHAPVTYRIRMVDEFKDDFGNFDVFNRMNANDPQVEVFDFHSQYGNALDSSLDRAPPSRGAEKVYVLASCKSKVFASRLVPRWPRTHFVWTKDGEYFSDGPPTLATMLREMANRKTWPQIHRALAVEGLANYHLPGDRKMLEYVDSDRDGIVDRFDDKLDCGRRRASTRDAFEPRRTTATPDGERFVRALTIANGVMGYNPALHSWEDRFLSDGFSPADPSGPIATFARDGRRVKVTLNAAYSDLSDTALAAALTREITLFAANGGRGTPTLENQIAAFETGVDLLSAWDPDGELFDSYQKKFPLPKALTWSFATRALDPHDGATRETIAKIRRKVSP